MDTTTLLIFLLVMLLVGSGSWYGRGRWYQVGGCSPARRGADCPFPVG
jgi:hypothetical protein